MTRTHLSANTQKSVRTGAMLLMTAVLMTVSGMSAAQQPPSGKPPQEAFDACASKQAGDQCQMTLPDSDKLLPGQCMAPPEGGKAACLPDNAPQGGKR
ncbi:MULTISPECIES: hypothetical protein [Cobetia]|uniref:Uncharacterized protein n=1 Tax=Cobetia crustatorum TaxID=553385 RepID=A0A558HQ08_9GAMM|nr:MULTISPECIES: hypothetical protein [Cobetia]TVU71216.1 hypothetical protein FQP86_06705 [Cobetia crustatorum]